MSALPQLQDARVTVVGLGLMGGSLAGALQGHCRAVAGVSRRAEGVEAAFARGLVDWGTTDLRSGVAEADVVVLATPVRTILAQMNEIASLLRPGCLLMDLGSTKAEVVAAMGHLPEHIQPLGGHPMCGKELSGIEAADPALYRGSTFILCPLARTSPAARALGQALVEATGARPLVLEPERQDFLVATMSHLPYLLACGLVSTADSLTSPDPAAWEIVAGGFRDTSRVAGSDVDMMLDILLTNRQEVLRSVETFQARLSALAHLLASGNEGELQRRLRLVRATRKEMFP